MVWYTGVGLNAEWLCPACVDARQDGGVAAAESVCEECFKYIAEEIGDRSGTRGKPGILYRAEPMDDVVTSLVLPAGIGAVVDFAPVEEAEGSLWVVLTEAGNLVRVDADTGAWKQLASATVPDEPDHEPWCDHSLRRRLHVSRCGRFAAVVNDYGRWGQVIDLHSGRCTLGLDGGDYERETVPLSFAFVARGDEVLAIHRTDWNRVDVSDAATGRLLTNRELPLRREGEKPPAHNLDYFHGALHVSPRGAWILDDGWVWHPVGIPAVWSVGRWLSENVWESEDGPTRLDVCARCYYWDHAMVWIDEQRIAVGGLGDDEQEIVDGVRVFDITCKNKAQPPWGANWDVARELTAFAGPAGSFFSDGVSLFSADDRGLARWDLTDGARTGYLPDFHPTRHNRTRGELAELIDGRLIRLRLTPPARGRQDPLCRR